jgi:hypothetical protein
MAEWFKLLWNLVLFGRIYIFSQKFSVLKLEHLQFLWIFDSFGTKLNVAPENFQENTNYNEYIDCPYTKHKQFSRFASVLGWRICNVIFDDVRDVPLRYYTAVILVIWII